MGTSLASFFTPLTDRLWSKWFARSDRECELCALALKRIRGEKRHFTGIVAGKTYNSEAAREAATVTSFELLSRDCRNLVQLSYWRPWNWRIRSAAQKLSRLADQRDAAGVLDGIERIEPLLEKRTRSMQRRNNEECAF